MSQKIRKETLTKFIKIFELYQVFMHNFLCKNAQLLPYYILFTKGIEIFWSGDISSICGINTFWTTLETLIKFIKIFELHQVFIHNFCVKMPRYSHHIFLTKRIDEFWIGSIRTKWAKNQTRKIDKNFWTISSLYT